VSDPQVLSYVKLKEQAEYVKGPHYWNIATKKRMWNCGIRKVLFNHNVKIIATQQAKGSIKHGLNEERGVIGNPLVINIRLKEPIPLINKIKRGSREHGPEKKC